MIGQTIGYYKFLDKLGSELHAPDSSKCAICYCSFTGSSESRESAGV
jgi:hypothetical protein